MSKTGKANLSKISKYDKIVVLLYRRITRGYSKNKLPEELHFDLDDVRDVMRDAERRGIIDKVVKNAADIKYTYDARRDLPPECEQFGYRTWLQNGKGVYIFRRTKRKNLIRLPEDLPFKTPRTEPEFDQTPPFVASLLGNDEQAVFTRVRNSGLISKFLGFTAWPIQGHHRTTVRYGQIEVDEVQAGIDGQQRCIVPISGKGGQDKMSWSQALNLNMYGFEKPLVDGLEIRSLGLWRDDDDTIWMVEFTPNLDIDDIEFAKVRRFRLTER